MSCRLLLTATLEWTVGRVPWLVLGIGGILLSLTLIYLILSRRGASRAVTKCIVLSVWAHVMLLGFAYLTSGWPAPIGSKPGGDELQVRWIDVPIDEGGLEQHWPSTDIPADPPAAAAATTEHAADVSASARDDAAERTTTEVESPTTLDAPPRAASLLPLDPGPPESGATSDAARAAPDEPGAAKPADDWDAETAAPPLLVEEATPVPPAAIDPHTAPRPTTSAAAETAETSPAHSDAEQILASTQATEPPADAKVIPSTEPRSDDTGRLVDGQPALLRRPLPSAAPPVPGRYEGRSGQRRAELAQSRGGSADTEAAVEHALSWLASAQSLPQGCWENRRWDGGRETREFMHDPAGQIQADTATTGLALLAFLGAGYTHRQGPYQDQVRRGLAYLIASQSPETGSLAGQASRYVAMYCHGIATLAVSEALIMTGDPDLKPVLERAVRFTLFTQHPVTGGWRYQRGDLGDTSQYGWQLMSLVSAQAAGVQIPRTSLSRAERWLDQVALGRFGGLACYTPDRKVPSGSMTAEAMVCRTFLERRWPTSVDEEAADYVAGWGARADATRDLYFCYYATLALYPLQDDRWRVWNDRLTDDLLRRQRTGGQLAGSWDTDTKWGPTGGRVYTTAMACLCLETYYRYLPVYELAMDRGRAARRR